MLCKQQTDNFHNIMINSISKNKLKTKEEVLELQLAGKLGNYLRTWKNFTKINKYSGPVTIRCKRIGSEFCKYNVEQQNIKKNILSWIQKDKTLNVSEFYFNESAPDSELVLQGEFMQLKKEYVLFMSKQKAPMREALKNGFHIMGSKVLSYLKSKMTKESWEDFILLHKMYYEAVIEFSVYSCNVGIKPNSNVIIWEVRNY